MRDAVPLRSPPYEVDAVIDALGLFCPDPVYQARRGLNALEEGGVLEVLADDPVAREDIPILCRRLGYRFLDIVDDDGELHFFIQKLPVPRVLGSGARAPPT